MNPYQAFEFGHQLTNREFVNPPAEMYKPVPDPVSFPQVQPIYQPYNNTGAYVNTKSKTPGRGRIIVAEHPIAPVTNSESLVSPVVSAFISTVVNTVPHMSIVNARVSHMPYEIIPTPVVPYVSHPTFVPEATSFAPYNGNIYAEGYRQVPYVNRNVMNNVPPPLAVVPYINNPRHQANLRINGNVNDHYVQQQCNTPTAKNKMERMPPAVKNILDSFAKVKVCASPKRPSVSSRIVNSTMDESTSKRNKDEARIDIMTYVNNDRIYERFMAKADDEAEKKLYAKEVSDSEKTKSPKRKGMSKKSTPKKQQHASTKDRKEECAQEGKSPADNYLPYVVKSTVNSVIGDLMDNDEEKIISGNVCPKIRSSVIGQPEVRKRTDSAAGTNNWPKLKPDTNRATAINEVNSASESIGPVQTEAMKQRCSKPTYVNGVKPEINDQVEQVLDASQSHAMVPGAFFLRQNPKPGRTEYEERQSPFRLEVPTLKLCDFYRSTPISSIKQHLSNRWKINQRCECCGETPLHFAVRLNSIELLEILASGARLDSCNQKGETALHVACEMNNEEMVVRLLDHQVNPNRISSIEEGCMSICMRKGHTKLAEVILRKSKVDLSKEHPESYLFAAIRRGSKDFVELFLNFNAEINYKDKCGNTAISLAVTLGHRDVIDCLIKYGANLAQTYSKEDNSLLHLACRENQESSVERLLYAGASVHSVNGNLERPLHLAARFSSTKIAHMLLTFNADIEAEDSWMRTPLYLAILNNNPSMVKYLLSHGASTKTVVAPLIRELKNNSFHMIKLLISHGLNLNQSDQLGQTLVEAALKYGNVDLLNYLSDEETSRDL